MAVCRCACYCVALRGPVWVYAMGACGFPRWPQVVRRDLVWPCVGVWMVRWSSEDLLPRAGAPRDFRPPEDFLDGHMWLCVALRGSVWAYGANAKCMSNFNVHRRFSFRAKERSGIPGPAMS